MSFGAESPETRSFLGSLHPQKKADLLKSVRFVNGVLTSKMEAVQHFRNVLALGAMVTEPKILEPKYDRDPLRAAMEDEHNRGVLYGLEQAADLVADVSALGSVEEQLTEKD